MAAENSLAQGDYTAWNHARTQWLLTNLSSAYRQSDHKDPKWDKLATNALASFALLRGTESAGFDVEFLVRLLSRKALEAGSADPMLEYLQARAEDERVRGRTFDPNPVFPGLADHLFSSGYPAICKLDAAIRAGSRTGVLTGAGVEIPAVMVRYRQKAMELFHEVLKDPTTPFLEVYDASRLLFNGLQGNDAAMEAAWKELEPALRRYSTNAVLLHVIKGRYYVASAWGLRSSPSAAKSCPEFVPRLRLAAAELEAAWKLDSRWPEIAIQMMAVQNGLPADDKAMDLWFQRAMTADPYSYRACQDRLTYLEPKWGGSEEKMLAFARQCASSTNWGGQVPLLMEKAHDSISKIWMMKDRPDYWKEVKCWDEIKAAFDRYYATFAQLKSTLPDAGSRSRLVRVAYRTRHYDEMLELIRGMKEMDYDLFGGEDQFRLAFRYANSKARQPIRKEEFDPNRQPASRTPIRQP
jgi:hypothetical protein